MDTKNVPMGGAVDWDEPFFDANDQFNDAMNSDSPFGNTPFEAYTNMNDYVESPGGLQFRAPSKTGPDTAAASGAPQHTHPPKPVSSVDNSSQDSSSDTSSMRKRKTTSESPISDTGKSVVKKEDSLMDVGQPSMQFFGGSAIGSGMLDHEMFGFGEQSNNSSPINPTAFQNALSLNGQVRGMAMPHSTQPYSHESPVQTINPATFTLGTGSRDQSPNVINAAMFNNSPNAMFSTPSTDSNETFNPTQTFSMAQNPSWPTDFNGQYTSPSQLRFTPSPVVTEATLAARTRGSNGPPRGRCGLHIAPISTKSRVETQITVIMTLETPPPNVEHLHLPLHTIAKSKLLSKEEVDISRALELHTMLVCTSAMRVPELKEKALRNAAAQSNAEIQRRAEMHRDSGSDEDRNDLKNIPEDDKPGNGGEVRICNNCIQRERKRAGRKKLKKEEEQLHWERYETERAVVFNSNEYLPWKAPEAIQPQPGQVIPDDYVPPEGSIQATAAMRIACYCRHQSEKEGFQVIFTLKDQAGEVVAQEISDSILITDDHKTHPPSFSTQMEGQLVYNGGYAPYGLQQSHSMVDMSAHGLPPGFPSSRSTGNLQGLGGYGQQYPQSHAHQLQHGNGGFASPGTSATMTPTSMTPTTLSRPASPTSAGNTGPNKKRKSSSFHKKIPSGLTMTPRVDTNLHNHPLPAAGMSVQSPFSPTGPTSAGFGSAGDAPYMTMPTSGAGAAQYNMHSGPSTPNDGNAQQGYFHSTQAAQSVRGGHDVYYQSLPSSRVGSRAPSPVSSTRPNLAAYARDRMSGAPSQALPRGQVYASQHPSQHHSQSQLPLANASGNSMEGLDQTPTIHKILPCSGEIAGGTEIALYGRNFTAATQVYFGDQLATPITFYGEKALICVTPPGRPGAVHVTAVPSGQLPQYMPSSTSNTRAIFEYKYAPPATLSRDGSFDRENNNQMMEFALRYLAQRETGRSENWSQLAPTWAQAFLSQNVGRAGALNGDGYPG